MKLKWLIVQFVLISHLGAAQELGAFVSRAWTDNTEMQNSFGFGAYLSKSFAGSFAVVLSFERLTNERMYDGYTSTGFGFNPVWEPIQSSTRTNIWKLRLSYFPLQYEFISLGVSSAVSTTSISISKKGTQTSRPVATQGGQKFGIGFALLTQATPIKSLPVTINIELERHFLGKSTSIATDSETPVYDKIGITRLAVGIGFFF